MTTDGTLDVRRSRSSARGRAPAPGARWRSSTGRSRATGSRSTRRRGGRRRRPCRVRRPRSSFRSRRRSRTPTSPRRWSRCARRWRRADPSRWRRARRDRSGGGRTDRGSPVGQFVTTRLLFKPDWPDVVVGDRRRPTDRPRRRSRLPRRRAVLDEPAGPRAPRSAVGQLADGRIVLVAVDGRQPGYSVGMTNFELAQTLVRLGAVTAMALDGGGSTTMAFDGRCSTGRRSRSGRSRPRCSSSTPASSSAGGRGRLARRRRRRGPAGLRYKVVRPRP